MNNLIRIDAPARLHVNLFDMSTGGYRQNGGVGFCISGFDTIIEFKSSRNFKIIDQRNVTNTPDEEKLLIDFLHRLYASHGYSQKFSLTFMSGPPPHSGFGTGTATKLACSEAASILNKITLNQAQLISASGRGGTSGVGINTYFQGGLSIDFGVKGNGLHLGPSSARHTPSTKPIQLLHVNIPADWRFGVIVSPGEPKISGKEEVDFFNKTCPIEMRSVHESIYHAVSGMACAAIEKDRLTFCSSINAIQQTQWKKAEWMAQSNSIHTLRDAIQIAGAECVGLSSLGPAVYFMSSEFDAVVSKLDLSRDHIISQCPPNNLGRAIEID